MTKDILKSVKDIKVSSDLPDLFLSGVAKYFIEKVTTPYIGNGTFKSGGAKLIGGVALNMIFGNNKISKIAKQALIMDGVEDVTTKLVGEFMNKGVSTSDNSINVM